jgi:protein-tyrosine phosphatase
VQPSQSLRKLLLRKDPCVCANAQKDVWEVRINVKVLFVCSGNAHRSPLAEALLKKLKPDWEVESAGLRVAIPISQEVKEYLRKERAEQYLKKTPENLATKRLEEYDLIVAMEEGHKDAVLMRCPGCKNTVVVWSIEDPYFDRTQAKSIYDKIKANVAELAQRGS